MVLAFVWLVIGAVTAGQRDYFDNVPATVAHIGTIAVTVFAGPLNLFGINPATTPSYEPV